MFHGQGNIHYVYTHLLVPWGWSLHESKKQPVV